MTTEGHHVIQQQRIKIAVSQVAIKKKLGRTLTDAEERLLDTPLAWILGDRRNIVKLTQALHHRAHHGSKPHRLREKDLPAGIYDFAAYYALEWALEHELHLMGVAA